MVRELRQLLQINTVEAQLVLGNSHDGICDVTLYTSDSNYGPVSTSYFYLFCL